VEPTKETKELITGEWMQLGEEQVGANEEMVNS